jgi:hypothetical protein
VFVVVHIILATVQRMVEAIGRLRGNVPLLVCGDAETRLGFGETWGLRSLGFTVSLGRWWDSKLRFLWVLPCCPFH